MEDTTTKPKTPNSEKIIKAQQSPRCLAKTRRGTLCQSPAMRLSGRCRMHGGKSPKWFAHPNYKHGLRSKYSWRKSLLNAVKRDARDAARRLAEIDEQMATCADVES